MGLHGAAPHAAQEGDPGYDGEPGSGRGGSGSRAGLGCWTGADGRSGAGGPRRGGRCQCGSGWGPGCGGRVPQPGGLLGVLPEECSSQLSAFGRQRRGCRGRIELGCAEPARGWQRRWGGTGCAQRPPARTAPGSGRCPRGAGGPAGCAPGAGGSPPAGTRSLPVPGYSMEVNGHTGPICWIIIANPRACRGQGTLQYFRAVHAALTCARELIFGEGLGYSEDRFRE